MPANDFYLDFGSNADELGPKLARDLKSARAEIKGFATELDGLNEKLTTTASRMVTIARARKGQTPEPRGQQAPAPRASGGGGGDADFVKHLNSDLDEYTTSLGQMIAKIGVVADTLGPITKQIAKDRAKVAKAKAGQKSYQTRIEQGDGPDAKGLLTAKGSGTTPQHIKDTGGNKPVEVRIASTSQGLIDEAAFKRIVNALEKNTNAVKANTAAVLRGGGRAAAAAASVAPAGVAAGTLKNQLGKRQQLAAIKQELARTQAGGEFDATAFAAAAGGRKRLVERGERLGHTGPEWEAQLTKTIKQLEKDLKGVPRARELRRQLGGEGGAAAPAAAEGTLTAAQRKALTVELEKTDAAIEAAEAELAAIRQEEAAEKETRKAKKAANRAAAQAAREAEQAAKGDTSLTGQQRANVREHLDVAGSESLLRKQSKAQLREIAESVRGEGGDLGFDPKNTKLTNERLIQGILKAAREIKEAGKTFHDLTTNKAADKISRQATLVAGKLREERQMTPTEQQAYELRRQHYRSGGEDEPIRGRQQIGGDFQQGGGSRWVSGAQAAINERNNVRLPTAAIDAALENMSRGRNVYSEKIQATGTSEDVRETKAALAAIRRATDAIDSMVDEFDELPAAIGRAEREVEKLRKEADKLKTPANIANQGRRATLYNQIQTSTQNEATRQKKIDELRALGQGTKTVEFTEQHKKNLASIRDQIKEETALRQTLRRRLAATDKDKPEQIASLKREIATSLTRSKGLEAGRSNLQDIKAGKVTTGEGLSERQQAALAELVNAQNQEITARKQAELELKKLSGGAQKNTQAQAKLTAAETKLTRLREQQIAMSESEEGGFVAGLAGSQKYRKGRSARDAYRATQDTPEARAARDAAAERAYTRMQESQASRMGIAELLGGPRTKQRATKTEREALYGLPGLQHITRGQRAGQLRLTAAASQHGDPKKVEEINKALDSYVATQKRIGEIQKRINETGKTEAKQAEELAQLKRQGLNDLTRAFNAYDEMDLQNKMGIGARRAGIRGGELAYDADAGPIQNTARRSKKRIAGESDADYQGRMDAVQKQTASERKARAAAKKAEAAANTSAEAAEIHQQAAKTDVQAAKEKNEAVNLGAAATARSNVTPTPGAPGAPGAPGTTARSKEQEARNAARAMTNETEVMAKLSAATRRQIAELAALKSKGAEASVIAEKQVKVYAAMANELNRLKMSTSAVRQGFQTVSAGAGVPVTHGETNSIARSANMRGLIASQGKQMGDEAENVRDIIASKLFGTHGFWSRVANSTGTFIVRNFTAGLVFGLTAALSDVVRQAIITESTFIRVSQALEATGRASGNLRTQLQQVSTDYGVALEDVYTTAAGLTGLFKDTDEIAGATRIAAQLQIISNGALNATEAMGALASITSAFPELSGEEGLEHIADVLTTIQNRLGVNIEVTAEGVGRLAGLAQQIGLSFEETAVYVGEIAKKTNQTGAAAGEQFSRIIAVMQTGRGQKALAENLGPQGIETALNNNDYAASLRILMENYNDLTDAQQTNIAITLGGQRQAASLAALLKDGAGALDTVRAATYSNGEAEKRAAAISKTLNVEVQKLQSNFVNLGSNLVRTGILGFFGALFIGVNKTLGALNTFLSTVNDIAESTPFVSFMVKAAVATIGLALAIKVLKASFAGLKAYMKSDSAGGAAMRSLAGPLVGGATGANGRDLNVRERLREGTRQQVSRARERLVAAPTYATRGFTNVGERTGSLGQALRTQQASLLARSAMQGPGVKGFGTGMLAQAAGGTAKALSGTASALTRVGQSAVVANVAMMALTIALTAAIMEMFASAQRAQDVKNAYEAVFTEEGKASEEEKQERYIGPATDFVKKNQKELTGVGGFFRGLGSGITGLFSGRGLGETAARNAGDIDSKMWTNISQPVMDGLDSFREIANDQFASIADVQEAAAQTQKDIADKAGEVAGNDDLSAEQKATALASLEADKKRVEDMTANMILNLQGLGDLDKWTSSQITEIMGMLSVFASSPSAGQNYGAEIQTLMESINVGDTGSSLDDDWAKLAAANSSTADLLQSQLNITNVAIKNARAVLEAKIGGGNEDEIAAASDVLKGLIQQGEQLNRAIVDSIIANANDVATAMRNTGNYGGAQAALDAAAAEVRARVEASKTNRGNKAYNQMIGNAPGSVPRKPVDDSAIFSPEVEQQLLNSAAATGQSAIDVGLLGLTQTQRAAARNTRNAIEIAKIQEEIAQVRLQALRDSLAAGTGATAEQVEDAEQAAIDATRSKLDTQQGVRAGKYAATSAGILNSVSKAQNDEAGAFQALAYARAQYGTNSEQYQSALAAARNASQSTQQAIQDQLAAARETELAMMAPADTVGRAQKTLSNARAAQANAARFGQSSVQYQQATQAVIEAQRGVDASIAEIADANSNLAITMAQAAGKTVDVARMKLEQAQVELQRAREKSGGAVTSATINAEAGVKQAQADLRDATLQDRLDTIDFQKNMDQITSRGAISMLTDLLNMKDLTEQQRRDILLRIKGLQDELSSSMEGAFNLPNTVKPPTVYEVRRALGIDDYLKSMKDATDMSAITGSGASGSAQQRILQEIQRGMQANGSAVPTQSQDYSNSNNNVTINGASFDDVVSWLQQYLGQGAQVVRTVTPRRY